MRIRKIFIISLGLTVCGGSIALAQSQPNFGPNAPSVGDSFGKPPSGNLPPMSGARAYAYRSHSYHFLHHRYHRRHRYY